MSASLLLPADDNFPADEEGDSGDEEYESEEKMAEALALNAQLKAMMAAAEEQDRRMRAMQMQRQQQQRPTQVSHHAAPGGARQRGQAAPNTRNRPLGQAKNGGWGGLTHTGRRSNEINRDNQILVTKLSNIAIQPRKAPAPGPFRLTTGNAALNRRKNEDKIARENAAMAKRLNSVKPTSTLSNKSTQKHAAQHNQLIRTLGGGRQTMTVLDRPRSGIGRPGSSPHGPGRPMELPTLRKHTRAGGGRPPFEF